MNKFWGKVRKHNQRGKKLGFPTANINLTKDIPEGIYISKTKIENVLYTSLTFIGKVKTFNENKFLAETYILDFNKDIYDKWISVSLIKKIRNNQKFNSAEGLIKQMEQDENKARKYWSDLKKKLVNEGYSEVSEKIGQLKLEAPDDHKLLE